MVALVIVNPIGGQIAFHLTASNVEAEAVPTIGAHFAKLSLEPIFGDEVACNLPVVVAVLLLVVVDLFVEVLVQDVFVHLIPLVA